MAISPTWKSSTGDVYFKLYKKTALTTAPFISIDPSVIMKKLIDQSSANGGKLTYTDSSIDNTLNTVTYTFNVNTLLEGINKCTELAPSGWFWYIDYSTNTVHFHQKGVQPEHTFSLEKDIIDAKFEKRIDNLINTVYFTGGDLGAGVNLFKKYTSSDSVTKYGTRSLKYTDQRVTLTATADSIANAILATQSQPELRVTLEILDSNNEQGLGYDIESIQVGDIVAVRNITQQVGLSTWDVSRWDESYWDFNIYNLSSLQMQVQRISYNQDRAIVIASSLPVDINKRIEEINRGLEQAQAIDNPTIYT